MMTFIIKKTCFEHIKSKKQKELYRHLSYYYHVRVISLVGVDNYKKLLERNYKVPFNNLKLKNGCEEDCQSIIISGWLSIGQGFPTWEASPGKKYFKFEIETVKAG